MNAHHPQIGVAIGGPTTDQALRAFDSIAGRAGIVELRVDLFSETANLKRLIDARPCPVVVTCRASVEGGSFRGSEDDRLDVLRHAAALGAEFVDVERFALNDLGSVAPTRTIVSQHDFTSMPGDLGDRCAAIRALGADVVKVAGMAIEPGDILPVLDVLANADVPTIAMAMGPAGVASRVVALRYPRCVLTYASLDGDAGTAPGQISISEMHEVFHAASVSASTRFFGLIAPSVGPGLLTTYNHLLWERGVDAVCVPLSTATPDVALLEALSKHGFAGFHVHGPGQQSLGEGLESIHDLNSISVGPGGLVGGHVSSPEEQLDVWFAHLA